MKKTYLLWFLLLFSIQKSIAQNNLPPVYTLLTDTVAHDSLPNSYWQMLDDKEGKLNFEQVSNPPFSERFHYEAIGKINFDITTYWFRFILKNGTTRPLKIGFYDNFKAVSDWYISSSNGNIVHKTGGLETPWSKNQSYKFISFFETSSFFIPLTIQAGDSLVIYYRVKYDYFNYFFSNPRLFDISYGSGEKAILENYVDNESHYFGSVHDAFFFGVMLLAAVFNIFFFLIIREKTYLYFALYVFFLGFGRFNIESEIYLLFLREHPVFYAYFTEFIWPFSVFFLSYFIRSLLNTKKYYPRWDRFLFYFNIFNFAAFVSSVFVEYYLRGTPVWGFATIFYNITSTVLEIFLVITLCLSLRYSVLIYKRFLFAVIPSFIIWIIGLTLFNLVPVIQFTANMQPPAFFLWYVNYWHPTETICLFWQVLCFLWLLFHRFIELKQQVVQKELEKEIERNQLIARQKIELESQVNFRTAELKQSLENLKSTQSRLIHAEKMASLGELTAGIAHEIQNPINFVNNFSEINQELLAEMKEEMDRGNNSEVKVIVGNVIGNEEKINLHGKRVDAIVKNMLQHSRDSTGLTELTDTNKLVEEYMDLSYNGLRAKDKSFKAVLRTSFDQTIGEIKIVPQDMGRVLLNLCNNAFYAIMEKKKLQPLDYEPTLTLTTKKGDGIVEISVKDNGNGIPSKVLDKIFQPFFTTKPAGQGTGLGLSLSYDIVKAHAGELKVLTTEGEGTEFIILIPSI